MRFSTVVAAAAFIGMVASTPVNVVYETEIITITSCAPDKPACPYATSTHVPEVVEEEVVEHHEPSVTPVAEEHVAPTPETVVDTPPAGNGTGPGPAHPTWSWTVGVTTTVPYHSGVPSGAPVPSANNTVPAVPTISSPPESNNAGKLGASFAAIAGVIAFAIMA